VSPAEPDDDAEATLLARVAAGEREAPMAELYARYGARVYGLGLRLLGDASLSEELVQETFVRLWQSAGRFDATQGSVRGWVWMLARRVAIDLQRRAAVRPRAVAPGTGAEGEPGAAPVDRLVAEDDVDRTLESLDVRDALERLTPKHREILALGYDEGLSQTQIAARLEIPLGTVKTRTYHALRALKDRLGEVGIA